MKRNRYLLFLPLLAVLYAPAAAQGYGTNFYSPKSCGDVVAALRARDAYFNQGNKSVDINSLANADKAIAWVFGYLTGRNYEGEPDRYSDLGKGLSTDSLALWLTNWCTQNPLQNIAHAAEVLVLEIGK